MIRSYLLWWMLRMVLKLVNRYELDQHAHYKIDGRYPLYVTLSRKPLEGKDEYYQEM